jgi:hypothetical protein
MLLLPTIQFDVARTVRSPLGTSSTNGIYLNDVDGHVDIVNERVLQAYPNAAMHSEYVITVESGTDIMLGDQLQDVTLTDGITPWPFDTASQHVTWFVVYAYETGPFYLASRKLFISRVWTQGPIARN